MKRAVKRKIERNVHRLKSQLEQEETWFCEYQFDRHDDFDTPEFMASALALKILFAYAIRIVEKHSNKSLSYDASVSLPALSMDMSRDGWDFLYDDISMYLYACDDVFNLAIYMLGNFGWKTVGYSNYQISYGTVDVSSDYAEKEVVDFIQTYLDAVKEDTECGGCMSVCVLSNKKYGLYRKYLEKHPKFLLQPLTEAIEECACFIKTPLAYYLTECADNMLSKTGDFVSVFCYGFCSGWEHEIGSWLITPACIIKAYYLECYLNLALKYVPGFRKFYMDEVAKNSVDCLKEVV